MTSCDFYMSLHSLATSNLNNKYFFYITFSTLFLYLTTYS